MRPFRSVADYKKREPRPFSTSKSAEQPAGSQAAYERLLAEARAISAGEVRPLRCDVALALSNAQRGVDVVLAWADRVKKELPGVSVSAIRGLPDLGLALAFADGQVHLYAPPPSEIKKLLARAHQLRGLILRSAEALAEADLLPGAAVARIRRGQGGLDVAGDCVALPALFQKHAAAVRGKSPLSAADLRESAELGSRLLGLLQPRSARRKPAAAELKTAVETRDRFWTLFERTWEAHVWRSGAWLFGRAVDEHVPPLAARAGRKRTAAAPQPVEALPGADGQGTPAKPAQAPTAQPTPADA